MQLAERKMAAQVKHKTNCDFDFLHIEQIHLHSFNAYKTTINLIQIDYFQNIRTINAIFSQFNRIFGKQKFRIRFTIAITQWNLNFIAYVLFINQVKVLWKILHTLHNI